MFRLTVSANPMTVTAKHENILLPKTIMIHGVGQYPGSEFKLEHENGEIMLMI